MAPKKYEIRSLTIPTKLEYSKDAREFVQEFLEDHGISGRLTMKLMLVADEAVVNAITHGVTNDETSEVVIKCSIDPHKVEFNITDQAGKKFDPDYFERIAKVKQWTRGGRGILLINRIMDEVMYVSETGKQTLLYMVKYISPEDKEEKQKVEKK